MNKRVCFEIHNLLNEKNLLKLDDIFSSINVLNYISDKSFISLYINYVIFKYPDLHDVYKRVLGFNNLMKRDCLKLAQLFYRDNFIVSEYYFDKIIKSEFKNDDLDFLIKHNMTEFIKKLDGLYLQSSILKDNFNDLYLLRKNKLPINVKMQIIDKFYKNPEYKHLADYLLNKQFNYIIDGCNLLFSNKGNPDFGILNKLIDSIDNPLVIIHRRHNCEQIKKQYYLTPYKFNDDDFVILAHLLTNKPIITNDLYKDHIFKFKEIEDFSEDVFSEYLINYDNEIKEIKPYSKSIQIIDNKIIIPTKTGFYIK